MEKKNYIIIWAGIQIISMIVMITIIGIAVPYQISHDQHMVDTVNERALDFEPSDGTITDFTDAEIMSNDAELEYEDRVWKLEHKELYWVNGIAVLSIISFLMFMLLGFNYISDYRNNNDAKQDYDEPYMEDTEPFCLVCNDKNKDCPECEGMNFEEKT